MGQMWVISQSQPIASKKSNEAQGPSTVLLETSSICICIASNPLGSCLTTDVLGPLLQRRKSHDMAGRELHLGLCTTDFRKLLEEAQCLIRAQISNRAAKPEDAQVRVRVPADIWHAQLQTNQTL